MKKKDPADELFRHSKQSTKDLHSAAKKRLREKARKEWWDKNGHGKGRR